MLDVALTREREIGAIFAGHPVDAHRKGTEFVTRVMLEQLDRAFDGVITSAAGYPLDLTFYQSIKGITAASHIVKPCGHILLVAECEEGAGAPEFQRMLRSFSSDREFMDEILHSPVTVDQWQLEKLALVTADRGVYFFVPGLSAEYWKGLWGPAFHTLTDALRAFFSSMPEGASIGIIPDGPYVLAKTINQSICLVND